MAAEDWLESDNPTFLVRKLVRNTYLSATSGGSGATLGANTFTGLQTITQASANSGIVASTGYSLTGSDATSMIDLAGVWNTTGLPTAIKLNITDTASDSSSLLLDLQVGGSSMFRIQKNGVIFSVGPGINATNIFSTNATFIGILTVNQATANSPIFNSTGYSVTGSDATKMLDLAGTWNTSGAPTAIKLNITNTASGATSLLMDLQVGASSKFSVSKAGVLSSAGSAGVTAGPFTVITSITVVGGIVTALTGS